MVFFKRQLSPHWLDASRQFPVLLLTGPRQAGKTSLLEKLSGRGRRYVSLDDYASRRLALDEPALFLERYPPPVLIDEIQYAPGLLPGIKRMVDTRRKPGDFWLTGSQPFHLMKGVTESLAGRVGIVSLLGLSSREKHGTGRPAQPFLPSLPQILARPHSGGPKNLSGIYRDIWNGSFPSLASGAVKNHELFYSSYIKTYLERDVRDLAQVGNLVVFARFLKACAARTGQILNMSDLARDTEISVNTARHWISILEASFQIHLLYPYHNNFTKRLVKAPKLYFLDTGLCAHLTGWSSPETLEAGAMAGAFLETHVFCEILKSWWNNTQTPSIFYYRDKDGREIDLVFPRDGRFYPLEIKKSASPKPDWVRHFKALERFSKEPVQGAVACLVREHIPIGKEALAIPICWI